MDWFPHASREGMGFGAFNEMVEFIATRTLPHTNLGVYDNTGWDLVSNMIGSVVSGMISFLAERHGRET